VNAWVGVYSARPGRAVRGGRRRPARLGDAGPRGDGIGRGINQGYEDAVPLSIPPDRVDLPPSSRIVIRQI
jgi:hypothetical protein